MTSPFLPEPERYEAVERLFDVLLGADTEETMTLSAMLVAKILLTYRVQPGSAHWKEFFKTLQTAVAKEIAEVKVMQTPLQ